MKVLFLDIDGVLNSLQYYVSPPEPESYPGELFESYPLCLFDPRAVIILNKIIEQGDIDQIVISSDWRNVWSIEELTNIFNRVGIKIPGKLDRTECIVENFSATEYEKCGRGYEIDKWVTTHNISKYLILDDDDRFLEYQKPHLVLTDYNTGLKEEHICEAQKIMNN